MTREGERDWMGRCESAKGTQGNENRVSGRFKKVESHRFINAVHVEGRCLLLTNAAVRLRVFLCREHRSLSRAVAVHLNASESRQSLSIAPIKAVLSSKWPDAVERGPFSARSRQTRCNLHSLCADTSTGRARCPPRNTSSRARSVEQGAPVYSARCGLTLPAAWRRRGAVVVSRCSLSRVESGDWLRR
jgi:hypothetical protein